MESNYAKQAEMARELFLKYEQDEMIEKFHLEHDEDYLYLLFIGDKYRILRETGAVEREDADAGQYVSCSDFNVVMTIYDVLCYSKETPELAHEWCPLHGLQITMSSPSADKFNQKYANAFAGKIDRLQEICRSLGGIQPEISAGADVCWQFNLFEFFPLQFRFWDEDDEFPAKIQLLWDRNSLKFMHFETLYYAMGHLMNRLLALMVPESQIPHR